MSIIGMTSNLLNRWNGVLKLSNLPKNEVSDKWWNIINTRYTEKQRYYHTLTHINELLKLEEQFSSKLKSPETVQWAIWFHDIVYDPTKHDNEDQSAQLFKEFSNDLKLSNELTTRVYNYIMATKNHTSVQTNGDSDLDYFLDFDLSILGTDRETYDQYSTSIRNEYIHIPDHLFKEGRSKILQKFIDAGYQSLFRTNEFREIYGKNSIENLKFELNKLSH
ncbi:hypothetical protein DICPUDRAFT_92502 [Dictyostelium purpureum]|uniref:HD domain-containing protein n=1 Tax=Dictyostelium purpureum TaxID=5786 RepID=F0ZSY0_DICPU|nr:uncharacterized protein DICPUDRAFT_92502 [Dictyostelium purpureum]EGC32959.1 hypothetical protein DICPUDRAFT_92502 [Dictyostelium purpureum]|eukprot:XP_003290525.1 hypothetical protein DICPUDRAFT_92502 [Dictyostelium purpureum]